MDGLIRLRGGKENNLKGIDLDLPTGELIVVTGPSGSGKSSLAFDTLYAEGQRRYIETFSPYTRQFLERMAKPKAEGIEGIPPAIAIGQSGGVRTTRSTVGTITEINDYLKLLFARVSVAFCGTCGREVRPETPRTISEQVLNFFGGQGILVTSPVVVPVGVSVGDFFGFLNSQGYLRVLVNGEVVRTDEPSRVERLPARLDVVQDRVLVAEDVRDRIYEAIERGLKVGGGMVGIWLIERGEMVRYSNGWHCAHCDVPLPRPTPGLFSFNHPLGACPECKGFGRVIGIDWSKVLPDRRLSIAQGVVRPFQGGVSSECQRDLIRAAARRGVDIHCPFEELPEVDQRWVIEGDGGRWDEAWESGQWYGVKGYFDWLETKTYKMHVRVLLSRYRNYRPCPACGGRRYQPDVSLFRIQPSGLTLPEISEIPVKELCGVFEGMFSGAENSGIRILQQQIASRLRFLEMVGLGYLTLGRPAKTLSGGELERVNLTACLGASLTRTLFVLDEPSVGLHPRDTVKLVEVLKALRDRGNTVLVVEHEEAVIRAADFLVDIGLGRGPEGGRVVYAGAARDLEKVERESLTRDYLTGRKAVAVPKRRREPRGWLTIRGIWHHNLKGISVDIPLGVLCCVTGVSGSGKSSLVHGILYPSLNGGEAEGGEDYGVWGEVSGDDLVRGVLMVDQSPLVKSPRSTPAVYVGVWDRIRELLGTLPEALEAGFSPSTFSFNSGDGRCERCGGLGFERVEMQFLSDVLVRCPECDGRRFKRHVLEVKWREYSAADLLDLAVTEALKVFRGHKDIEAPLRVLDDVGLGYLKLGQPVSGLSGGESQRLKLAAHLVSRREPGTVMIFDEPTTGLHFDDVACLIRVFQRLVDEGEHVVVVEHNMELVKCADWVIDLGPDAGVEGGKVVATGRPEDVARTRTHTGRYLARVLEGRGDWEQSSSSREREFEGRTGFIAVRGAREHNLKNVSLDIPHGKMVVVTGLSGSGKSTLAFDILFAEGQRRFLDCLSAYARQFVEQLEKPDVDSIEGLPPSVAIEQRVTRGGAKSTVATVTEIYHYLRLLFAKTGTQYCPECNEPVIQRTVEEIGTIVEGMADVGRIQVFAPLVRGRKGNHSRVARWAASQGIEVLRVNGRMVAVKDFKNLARYKEHTIEAFVGEVRGGGRAVRELIKRALELGKGTAGVLDCEGRMHILSTEMNCPRCSRAFEPLDPRLFSFNSPHGWCGHCRGFGVVWSNKDSGKKYGSVLEEELAEEQTLEGLEEGEAAVCPVCRGSRINEVARSVRLGEITLPELVSVSAKSCREKIEKIRVEGVLAEAGREILSEIRRRLEFLERVGLDYLSLDRGANTLSGGESQRIRLAAQLGSNLRGVLYVLDEPTIGLHASDNSKLLDALCELARNGNTLVVVEHDEETIRRADHLIDLGPGAGREGGEVVAQGTFCEVLNNPRSVTGEALKNPMRHPLRGKRRELTPSGARGWLVVEGARLHNLRNIDVQFPINRLSVVTGVSGSGKSSLVRGVLQPAVKAAMSSRVRRGKWDFACRGIRGFEEIGGILMVDQSPIGKTSRSTPATYIKVFDEIRNIYAGLALARMRGYSASRFSFNNEGGRCEACQGQGVIKVEMNFLPPAYIPCEECGGRRFNSATLEVEYNGRSIGDVLDMTASEAAEFFSAHPKIKRTLDLMVETGLGYLRLGQASPTLSGGEAQRLKLVHEVAKRATARGEERRTGRRGKSTLYLLEEPTIGLHARDVGRLIGLLHRLVDEGGTVVVVEHHLDLIAEADYVVDLGPGAGEDGGMVVARGTPEEVSECDESRTAVFLRHALNGVN